MYQNEISDLPQLADEKYENIFKIYQDEDSRYYYNLLETISFPENLPDGYFTTYIIQPGDTYPFISYKLFKTTGVWWVITLANQILDPTQPLEVGTALKIPTLSIIREIIKQINTQ